jgi:hypothetical protein
MGRSPEYCGIVSTPTKAEERFCRRLRRVLARFSDGEPIECNEGEAREYLDNWERYVSEVLSAHFEEFGLRTLDGISPTLERRISAVEAELAAMCWLIEGQVQVPTYLRVRLSSDADAVEELDCRWGEADSHGSVVRGGTREKKRPSWPTSPMRSFGFIRSTLLGPDLGRSAGPGGVLSWVPRP